MSLNSILIFVVVVVGHENLKVKNKENIFS